MNWTSWFFWGFVATLLETTLAIASQGMGLTRMNLPYMLGTIFTPDRDKARLYGFLMHMANGWGFSLLYVIAFNMMGSAGWWRGLLMGVIHGLIVLVVGMAMLPGLHPRMASEHHGPSPNRELEPPGFMAIHYGIRTPVAVILSHALFGVILGAFYHLR